MFRLCKIKYYNNCLFYNVQRNFIAQTGDPTNTGKGGDSIYGILYGQQARFFPDEIRPHLKHTKIGLLGMASAGENMNASQFYITTGSDLISLDERHTIFGEVAEGFEVLEKINECACDREGRPLQNIRIRHTNILDDPFPDSTILAEHIPSESPPPIFADDGRLEDDWVPQEDERPQEEIEAMAREREAQGRAVVLEMIGDLPAADVRPPDTVLFVCKLNPVTTEEDLEIIFSRFGNVTSCDIIRDWKTGDSLCYAFIGFETQRSCEEAYFKMNNVLIDDRRIKVDFSQSVSHLWKQFKTHGRRGDSQLSKEADLHERNRGLQLKEQFGGSEKDHQRGIGNSSKSQYDLILHESPISRRRSTENNDRVLKEMSRHSERDSRYLDRQADHVSGWDRKKRDKHRHTNPSKHRRRDRSRSRDRISHEKHSSERRSRRRHSRSRSPRRELERSRGKRRSRSRDRERTR